MAKKYLVTGPTGSTESKTVKFLLAAGAQVRAYVHRQDERSAALSALGAELVAGDLLDFEAVRSALKGTAGATAWSISSAQAHFHQSGRHGGSHETLERSLAWQRMLERLSTRSA